MRQVSKMNKRGISPIIATVILVGVVVTLAVIVWVFSMGFVSELVLKEGVPGDSVCANSVRISANIIDNDLIISNDGAVPIAGVNTEIKINNNKDREWRPCGLDAGESSAIRCDMRITGSYDEVKIIPSIQGEGENSGSSKLFNCEQKAIILK